MWGQILSQGLGIGLQVFGSVLGGSQKRQAGEYNKKILYQKAKMQEQAMEVETSQAVKSGRRLKASQEAMYAKSGAMIDSGTPLLVMVEQAGEMNRDILQNRRSRMIQAEGYRHEGDVALVQAENEAKLDLINTMTGVAGNVAGSLLQTGGGTTKPPTTLLNKTNNDTYGMFNPQMNTINSINNPKPFTYKF